VEPNDPAETVNPGLLETFPERFSDNRDLVVTVLCGSFPFVLCSQAFARTGSSAMGLGCVKMGMFEVGSQVPKGTDPMLGSHLFVRQLLECSFNRFML
jgi:hypothetical protein